MPTARYFIVKDQEEWRIQYGQEEFGPYRSYDEAMMFAIDAAKGLGARGENAEVCLMGENGHFCSEWTSHEVRPHEARAHEARTGERAHAAR